MPPLIGCRSLVTSAAARLKHLHLLYDLKDVNLMSHFADLLLMTTARPQAGYDGTEGMEPGGADAGGEAAVEPEAADLIEEKVG